MKRAIALSGGGTKGSYEVGVWKALLEKDIDYQIVTGTSIGSINGAFMVTKQYDEAYELWNTITMADMMEDGINLTETLEGILEQKQAIRPFLKKYVKNKGADISPYTEFVDRMIDEQAVMDSDIDYGLVTVQFPSLKGIELAKKDIPRGMLKEYILASAAIFPLFPMHKIGTETYLDGCYYDNLPIDFAFKMGADEVIAVDLRNSPAHPNYVNRPYVTYIKPSSSLGTMMNFDHQLLLDNMQMGYCDAMKMFGKYKGFLYTFTKFHAFYWKAKIEKFSSLIAKAEAVCSENSLKKLAKPGDMKNAFGELEAHLGEGRRTKEDYFIRGAELAGEVFALDKREVYEFSDFIKKLRGKILAKELCDGADLFVKKNKHSILVKLTDWSLNKDSAYITSCIYFALKEEKIDSYEKAGCLTILPKELLAAAFLFVCL